MIAGKQYWPFACEQFRFIDDDLPAKNGQCQPCNNFNKLVEQTVIFVNIGSLADE
jgi:hypothetical protein